MLKALEEKKNVIYLIFIAKKFFWSIFMDKQYCRTIFINENLRKYVRKKEVEVNAEKMKIMVFEKKRKREENEWNWQGRKIEQVNELHSMKEHITERS
jgi:hypothetical protein